MRNCKLIKAAGMIALFCGVLIFGHAFAQTYHYQMGYIFAQPFVTRINVTQQQTLINNHRVVAQDFVDDAAKIMVQKKSVSRNGALLTIKFIDRPALVLSDFISPETKDIEGDSQLFRYNQLITETKTANTYHQIDVYFSHDQPAVLLVNAKTGKIYFVDAE